MASVGIGVAAAVALVAALQTERGKQATRAAVSGFLAAAGFVANTAVDVSELDEEDFQRIVDRLNEYLETTGLKEEFSLALNERFFFNMLSLREIQKKLPSRRDEVAMKHEPKDLPTMQQAERFMKFSTAVYGPSLIGAAQVAIYGEYKFNNSDPILKIVASHLNGVQVEDIVSADLEAGDSTEYLRHMVVVDHKEKALVLAIRGTFALSSTLTDVAAFSEEFCGGQAHAGMAKMARAVWRRAEEAVLSKLNDLPDDYSLVITGHSAGAGVACLIAILIYNEELISTPHDVRCMAYAPPPVFCPLSAAEQAVQKTVAYVNNYDCVPSSSVYSARRLMKVVAEIDKKFQEMFTSEFIKAHVNYEAPSDSLVETVRIARKAVLPPKEGAPLLVVPAKTLVWMEEIITGELGVQQASYSTALLDTMLYADRLLDIHPASLSEHHHTTAYEIALLALASIQKESEPAVSEKTEPGDT